jgi:hypothetical protein
MEALYPWFELFKQYKSLAQPLVLFFVAAGVLKWFTWTVSKEVRKITSELRGQLEAVSRKFDRSVRKTVTEGAERLERTTASAQKLLKEAQQRAGRVVNEASDDDEHDNPEDEASRWGEMQALWADVREWASGVLDEAQSEAKSKREIAGLSVKKTDYSLVTLALLEYGWINEEEAAKTFEMYELYMSYRSRKKWLDAAALEHFQSLYDEWTET